MKMASLKDISERYKRVCESFIKKTVKTGLKDKGDSIFQLPENYIEIALMKIIESRGIEEVDIDYSEILQENPIDKSKWVPTLVYIDTDDTLGVRWDKFLAYNTECGCIDVYEDTDSYESFFEQDEYVQTELYREVMNALGMEYVEPKTMYYQTLESFTHRVSRKRSSDLVSDIDYPDGVYILHETLGVNGVEGWNPKNNNGVVGILVVEDEHKIVVALEDSPENLTWSEKRGLINQPVDEFEDAKSDFNGEYYCQKLDSPDFPAAYYCLNYKKGNRKWYLPSSGELWLIYRHLEEVQTALSIVGGQKFITTWDKDVPVYWSSTEGSTPYAWRLHLDDGYLNWNGKVSYNRKVRPVSNFSQNKNLKESFTKKIKSTRKSDLNSKPSFVLDNGVYILHETLGVKTVGGWNPNDNNGVVGILVVEDEHKIVVALEDAPEKLCWSKKRELINEPIKKNEDAESDFNGEQHCLNLNSPDFPAAYYCLNYKKGGRKWYLPSIGELWMIYNHLEEIQTALETVGGQKFFTDYFDENIPCYWSSTEFRKSYAWKLDIDIADDYNNPACDSKGEGKNNVRPVSNFSQNKNLKESFTKKISQKRNDELILKSDITSFVPDGVYILHETLGVRTVNEWNPEDNDGVVGVLVVEDEHQIVIALEDSPKLRWSKRRKLVNRPIEDDKDAEFDFNGEDYCKSLNSPDFPAAYYCLNYKKGGLDWYLPSAGELWLIYRHLKKIQIALKTVKGKKLVPDYANFLEDAPCYWSSTESNDKYTWALYLNDGLIRNWGIKVRDNCKVRPVSNFRKKNTLKESFTKKIYSKKNTDLVPDLNYPDGVYILHETLGVRTVDSWNPKDDEGVVGILVIEDDHKIVVALEDSPKNLLWLKERNRLINEPIKKKEDAKSDFNGEEYCIKLNSPDFPADYYCKTYNKGGRNWYLPSSGELWLICRHLKEIQNALETVGGQKFLITAVENDVPWYWSSTESSAYGAWGMFLSKILTNGDIGICNFKVSLNGKVRPVSNFNKNKNLKESFTRKTSKTKGEDLRTRADESVLPKNYIDLALMSVLCSAKKEGICFRKPKFRYKGDFGDVYELSEIFLQNDGFEIGSYEQNHYLEIEWNVYENGYMEEEPVSDVYPFKDEDNEIKTEIYKRVLQYLGMEYVSPNIRWMEFDDEGFDYFDN